MPPSPRFNHHAALCELLPVAVPSLLCCVKAFFGSSNGSSFGPAEVAECSSILNLDPPMSDLVDPHPMISSASFPGWRICAAVRRHALFCVHFEGLVRGGDVKERESLSATIRDNNLRSRLTLIPGFKRRLDSPLILLCLIICRVQSNLHTLDFPISQGIFRPHSITF